MRQYVKVFEERDGVFRKNFDNEFRIDPINLKIVGNIWKISSLKEMIIGNRHIEHIETLEQTDKKVRERVLKDTKKLSLKGLNLKNGALALTWSHIKVYPFEPKPETYYSAKIITLFKLMFTDFLKEHANAIHHGYRFYLLADTQSSEAASLDVLCVPPSTVIVNDFNLHKHVENDEKALSSDQRVKIRDAESEDFLRVNYKLWVPECILDIDKRDENKLNTQDFGVLREAIFKIFKNKNKANPEFSMQRRIAQAGGIQNCIPVSVDTESVVTLPGELPHPVEFGFVTPKIIPNSIFRSLNFCCHPGTMDSIVSHTPKLSYCVERGRNRTMMGHGLPFQNYSFLRHDYGELLKRIHIFFNNPHVILLTDSGNMEQNALRWLVRAGNLYPRPKESDQALFNLLESDVTIMTIESLAQHQCSNFKMKKLMHKGEHACSYHRKIIPIFNYATVHCALDDAYEMMEAVQTILPESKI